MNTANTLRNPSLPDHRVALERARAALMDLAERAVGRFKNFYGVTVSRIAAKRQAARESGLSVEGRVSLGPKKSLVLVHCHGRRYLVASAGDTMAPIVEVLPVAAQKTPAARKLSQTRSKTEGPGKGRTQ